MKKLLKRIKIAAKAVKRKSVPIMIFFIVVLALTPYCREVRGYYAIGSEYILAGFVALGVSKLEDKLQRVGK